MLEEIIKMSKLHVSFKGNVKMISLRYVDVHIHLSDAEYSGKVDMLVDEARRLNVVALVSNSMDLKTSVESLKLAERHPRLVYVALGVHPWSVSRITDQELRETCQFILKQKGNPAVIAIGEVGLDNKYVAAWDKQMMVFDAMLHLAEKLNLPVIIHSRGTTSKIVEMLPSYSVRKVLLHWFSNPISLLPKVIDRGYYISEGPPVAYSNGIQEIIRKVPLTNLLTETDGPVRYFGDPFKGSITTPAFIPIVVEAIARIKHEDIPSVAEQITKNFEVFFDKKVDFA